MSSALHDYMQLQQRYKKRSFLAPSTHSGVAYNTRFSGAQYLRSCHVVIANPSDRVTSHGPRR